MNVREKSRKRITGKGIRSGRKLLALFLSLGMLLFVLTAGLPVTAAHAYEGNPYAALVNTTAVVRFNNIDWYLIKDSSTAVDAGTVTLLTKKCLFVSEYRADDTTGGYEGSTVEANVNKYYKEQFSAVRHAVADNGLFLLSLSGYLPDGCRRPPENAAAALPQKPWPVPLRQLRW